MYPYKPKSGYVEVFEQQEDGSLIKLTEGNNLFVNTSFDILSGALLGQAGKAIDTIAIGSGGILNSVPQTPNLNDTALYNEVFRKVGYVDVEVESILEPNHITFKFIIDEDESNSIGAQVINEVGLFSNDGTMFSRKILATEVVKSPNKAIIFYWKIIF